jgi:selenocysteine lyase/cysteine desulfurase
VFFAGKVGLSAALAYASQIGIDAITERNRGLATRLRHGLAELPGVTLRDKGAQRCAIVTFTVDGHAPAAIQRALREQSINVSTSSMTSARLDFPERGLDQVVRSSVHYYNDEADVDALVVAIANLPRRG